MMDADSSTFHDPQSSPFLPRKAATNQHEGFKVVSSTKAPETFARSQVASCVSSEVAQTTQNVPIACTNHSNDGYESSLEGESCLSSDLSSSPCFSDDEMGADETPSHTYTATFIDDEGGKEGCQPVSNLDSKPTASHSSDTETTSHLLRVGPDVVVSLVKFLDPAETLRFLTMPLCKEWRQSYTAHQDLWMTLCCDDPFSAKLNKRTINAGHVSLSEIDSDNDDDDDDDDSFCTLDEDDFAMEEKDAGVDVLSEYRLLYTSFVRCRKYLDRILEDARNGRQPSVMDYGNNYSRFPTFGVTKSLKKFLAKKKHGSLKSVIGDGSGSFQTNPPTISNAPIGVLSDGTQIQQPTTEHDSLTDAKVAPIGDSTKPKYGKSMITDRLFGPTDDGTPSHLNLPTSCAIYSIVNWMVAHPDVEGIQTMCICALPALLEDEQQRVTAQRVGLVEVILCGMLRFPESANLHTAAFHTMVLLARPIGGREGMLFDNSMAESTRSLGLAPKARYGRIASSLDHKIQPSNSSSDDLASKPARSSMNGVSILIASMERFGSNEKLQAMACWAMVNLALVPAQKTMLIGLNGIQAAVNAMTNHPRSFDVQFRALFALINLVVPSKTILQAETADSREQTEKDILDQWTSSITGLVISAMENFCTSSTILNRGCLVLHNLSQTPDYIPVLLWTPHCYQMLEWCRTNHSTDTVLLRSASSTLGRIQSYLSHRPDERQKFVQSIQRKKQEQLQSV
ncbi:hypothetical protein IV203_035422 [Nitzschia inconspicua]|uniref:Uncharacterized protein n=1 Tax=Nitzschia inconspicua TaxID=303405 RepID=A0A9K3K476_9STRA|nr:hypothetical protein IV203_006787 [Nitzschia inconspicua]KAG7360323.1 hypothetical protein IV203_035422 [Nitzschia inconspicua]